VTGSGGTSPAPADDRLGSGEASGIAVRSGVWTLENAISTANVLTWTARGCPAVPA
jgi:hypothetical protein